MKSAEAEVARCKAPAFSVIPGALPDGPNKPMDNEEERQVRQDYSELEAEELRASCRSVGLPAGGTKAAMIDRLVAAENASRTEGSWKIPAAMLGCAL